MFFRRVDREPLMADRNHELHQLTAGELGRLFPIILREYDPRWPRLFSREKRKILPVFPSGMIYRFTHIGSTAVPGLTAKPTIDILLEIRKALAPPVLIRGLQKLGYQAIPRKDNPPPHLMLVRGYTAEGFRGQAYHVHVRYPGDWDEVRFRDFLRDNPATAEEYGQLKIQLAGKYRHDRDGYTDAKTEFIGEVLGKAKKTR